MSRASNIAAVAVDRKAQKEKKKIKKKVKRSIHRLIRGILWTGFVLCLGVFIGIHRNVIKTWLEGKELPEAPAGHCCHKK